jgi:hypothetical protein
MNSVFRVYKYPVDYAAFTGKTLTSGDFIEKYTTTGVSGLIDENAASQVFPNPFTNRIVPVNSSGNDFFELFNGCGQSVWKGTQIEQHDFSGLLPGFFFLNVSDGNKKQIVKLIKQ